MHSVCLGCCHFIVVPLNCPSIDSNLPAAFNYLVSQSGAESHTADRLMISTPDVNSELQCPICRLGVYLHEVHKVWRDWESQILELYPWETGLYWWPILGSDRAGLRYFPS